jgi:hypothetical protein
MRRVRTPFPTGSEGQPGHAINRQGLLDENLHLNRLRAGGISRAKAQARLPCSKAVRSAHVHGRGGARGCLVVIHCYFRCQPAAARVLSTGGASNRKRNQSLVSYLGRRVRSRCSPAAVSCIFPVVYRDEAPDCSAFGEKGKQPLCARAIPPRSAAGRAAAASGRPTAA